MKLKLKVGYLLFLILLVGILLFGCATNQGNNNGENNVNVQQDANVQPDTPVQPGTLEFSVPSELPIAYVGKPYLYSFCDPQPEKEIKGFDTRGCGVDVTPINPKGGKSPYEVTVKSLTKWNSYKFYSEGSGLLKFTPELGDEGQYVLEACAKDTGASINDYNQVCKNTTLYIMSDVVTVKGEGELTHDLMLNVVSDAKAADFAGHEDVKEINTHYAPTASFSPLKVTAEVPAASSCVNAAAWCGGGSHAEFDATASATSVSMTADGSAACGRQLQGFPGEYEVDYYHVGFYTLGYGEPNVYIALNITNTGTKEKAIDVQLDVRSELDPGSQNYFKPATAFAEAYIGDHYISVPNAKPGDVLVNSTVFRVLVRPGRHWIHVGSLKDHVDNTNMLSCPSFVKASSKVSVTIVPADMSDGKKEIGSVWSHSHPVGSDVKNAGVI